MTECKHDKGFVRVLFGDAREESRGHFEGEDWITDQPGLCEMKTHYESWYVCTECNKEMQLSEARGEQYD
jgi:hypothetical protein